MAKTSHLFIKGPISYDWIKLATSLGKSPGLVGWGLWLYKGLNGSNEFKIDHKLCELNTLSRQVRQKGLRKLEMAGLIKLHQPKGEYPYVTILFPDKIET